MSLRIVYGRAGTGKTSFCFNQIKEYIEKQNKIYIITPEQFSFTAEQRLLETIGYTSSIQAEVITFNRIANRILNNVEGIKQTILSESSKQMLMYSILTEQKGKLNFLGKSEENVELLINTISEFKKHNIDLGLLNDEINKTEQNYLKLKLQDIYCIYEKYQEIIKNNYIDSDDLLSLVYENIEKSNMFQDSIIYIDEFAGFTPQEYEIIRKLLKIAQIVTITICAEDVENKEKNMFYSNNKTYDKLINLAKEENIKIEEAILLKQAHRFKSEELRIVEENLYSFPYEQYKEKPENVTLFLSQDSYKEIEHIAMQIIHKVRDEGYKYNDIAIITKNIENYNNIIKSVFHQYNIPVFIDEKKDLSQNILIKYILSVLDIFSKGWTISSVFASLKTGFYDINQDEIFELEKYCTKWGIKGKKWYEEEWQFGKDKNNEEEIKHFNEIRNKIVEPIINFKKQFTKAKTAKEITAYLYEFLRNNKIEEKLNSKIAKLQDSGEISIANDYVSSMNILVNILDEIVELFGEQKMSFDKYYHLLKIACNGDILGSIPATLDQVIVGDTDRTRTHKILVSYIIGVNDGEFPSNSISEGFLNDKDRIHLREDGIELAKITDDLLYEEQFNIYKAFSISEKELHISYTSSDKEGGSKRPSMLISKIKKIFPSLEEESNIIEEKLDIGNKNVTFENLLSAINKIQNGEKVDDIWYEIYNIYAKDEQFKAKLEKSLEALYYKNEAKQINEQNILRLYGNTMKTSVSKLEQYRKCPFSFFLKYGLKLKENEELQLKSIDTGSFMHEVIDNFFEHIEEKQIDIKQLEEQDIKKIVEKIIEDILNLPKNYIFSSTPKFINLTNRLKKVVTQSICYIVYQLQVSSFEIVGTEIEFDENSVYEPIIIELENGKKVEITGKIDRIDIAKTSTGKYLRIIDYKSSAKDIDLNEVYMGLQLQLLTYMDAATKIEEALPAGILYFGLMDNIIKSNRNLSDEELRSKISKQFKMNGLILADMNIVKMMDKKIEKGYSDIIPVYVDKDGNLSNTRSSTVTKEQFENLQKHTKKLIKQISKEILSGNINIKPYYNTKTKKSVCQYCSYKSICNFNTKDNQYLYCQDLDKQDILEKISEE